MVLDVRIGGTLPSQIKQAQDVLLSNLQSVIRLDSNSGLIETVLELPRFAWLEAVVNAVTHRSYSHQGDHIRVQLFDDRMEVESPGRLPGSVRIDNIRHTRFSRNPRISRVLADLKFVQELNEGVNRMFEEMERAGLPEPVLQQTESGFKVTLYNNLALREAAYSGNVPRGFELVMEELTKVGYVTVNRAVQLTGLSAPTVRRHLSRLASAGVVERVATSATDPTAFWVLNLGKNPE